MKNVLLILAGSMLLACNSETASTDKTEKDPAPKPPEHNAAPAKPNGTPITEADVSSPTIGEIDFGKYILRVHEAVQYHPSEMNAKVLNMDDKAKDYYLFDVSVENKTDEVLNVGVDMLQFYANVSDGTTREGVFNGASVVGAYNAENGLKYAQTMYDQIFGDQFPPKGKARGHMFGVTAPEGAKVTEIGFYKNNAAKKKSTSIK